MPLSKGKSQRSFVKNIKTELAAGKPMKQSLAIAYAMKRKKMSHGGKVEHQKNSPNWKAKGWTHEKDYNKGVHRETTGHGESHAGSVARKGFPEHAKEHHKSNLASLKAMPNPKLKGLAEGGEVQLDPDKTKAFVAGFSGTSPEPKDDSGEEGIVDRIMKRFSKGGQVANDTHPFEADFEDPNEFDDLVLDDELEPHFDGALNEEGDPAQDKRTQDLVSRIMSSRKKKDHNPRPA